MNIITSSSCTEYTEKKSKFISNVFYADSEFQAKDIIFSISQKYADATHNVYAYKLMDNGILKVKFSDAGEPRNTAGKPILELINKLELCNILIVVTRYFGGIKLGASGLVRAYMKAAGLAIDTAKITKYIQTDSYNLIFDYKQIGFVENIIDKSSTITVKNKIFDTKVRFDITATESDILMLEENNNIVIKK